MGTFLVKTCQFGEDGGKYQKEGVKLQISSTDLNSLPFPLCIIYRSLLVLFIQFKPRTRSRDSPE